MGADRPINCIKYLVFAFNLLFFVFGLALVGVGAYVQLQLKNYLDFFNTDVNGPAVLLIVVGMTIVIISFFGCCGAIKENYCMMLTFSILMMIILVCQVIGSIAGFVYYNKIRSIADEEMKESLKNYHDSEKGGVTAAWDWMQRDMSCCGVSGPYDWKQNPKYSDKKLPPSCCDKVDPCTYTGVNATTMGCLPKVEVIIKDNVYYVGAVGIALAVIQVTGIVLSCCLARAVRKEYDV